MIKQVSDYTCFWKFLEIFLDNLREEMLLSLTESAHVVFMCITSRLDIKCWLVHGETLSPSPCYAATTSGPSRSTPPVLRNASSARGQELLHSARGQELQVLLRVPPRPGMVSDCSWPVAGREGLPPRQPCGTEHTDTCFSSCVNTVTKKPTQQSASIP